MSQSKISSDDKLRRISELLKSADRYVLASEFDKAHERVQEVFDLDPDNLYARAYLNRIEVFRSQAGEKITEAEAGGGTASEMPADTESPDSRVSPDNRESPGERELPDNFESPDQRASPDQSPETDAETGSADETVRKQPDDRSEHPLIQKKDVQNNITPEEQRRIIEDIVAQEQGLLEETSGSDGYSDRADGVMRASSPEEQRRDENEKEYREALKTYWRKGNISKSDRQILENLGYTLEIDDERQSEIERSVKLESYVNAVKEAWQDGLITPTGAAALDELRDRFSISIGEHLMIESRIMYELHGLKAKGVIMVIDDDVELVKIIKSILRENGYATFSAHSPEHAIKILERTTPDLILLDVTFPKPSISGFTMYERIRQRPRLRFVPVIFLSGLDEEHIVQLGKKLGADDYIVKPCSEEMLISSIEGKIKRYKELRKMH